MSDLVSEKVAVLLLVGLLGGVSPGLEKMLLLVTIGLYLVQFFLIFELLLCSSRIDQF